MTVSTKRATAASANSSTSISMAVMKLPRSCGISASSMRNLIASGTQVSNSTATITPTAIKACSRQ